MLIFDYIFGQNKYQIDVKGDLYSFPISNSVIELGPGYYPVSGKAKVNEAFYLGFNYWVHKNFGFTIGAGIHTYNYQVDFMITDPMPGEPAILNETRVLSATAWSPTLGAIFRKGNFTVSLNVAEFDPLHTENSVGSSSATHLFFDENHTDPILILKIDENIGIIGDPGAYQMLQFSIRNNITKCISFHVGYELALNSGRLYHYQLLINELANSNPTQEILRNDFRITTKYHAITLGIGYQFNFGKYKTEGK